MGRFICPVSGAALHLEHDKYVTSDGKQSYPIANDIAILIPDHDAHLRYIQDLQGSHRRDWFTRKQLDYYDAGPYRFHLARRRQVVQESVKSFICGTGPEAKQPPVILDLGCGDGASTRWLVPAVPQTSAFLLTDYSPDRLEKARRLIGGDPRFTYFLSDATRSPVADNTCDIVFCHHVIEHTYDDNALCRTAYRVLKPGGLFLLGCPNEGVLFWMLAYALRPESIRQSDHLHFYNADLLVEMGNRAGFTHQRTHVLGYGIPHWRLDALLRQFKLFDDLFHFVGRRLFRNQGSSLYVLFTK